MKISYRAGGIVVRGSKVVLVNNFGDSWGFPKGGILDGEDELSAAKREIFEETGISDLILKKKLATYSRHSIKNGREDKSENKIMFMFLFEATQKKLRPHDPENPEARWLEKEEVINLLTHPKDKEFFLDLLKKKVI